MAIPFFFPVINDGAKTAARGNPVNRVNSSTNDAPRWQANTATCVTAANDRCWHRTIEGGNFNSTQILARIVPNKIAACPPMFFKRSLARTGRQADQWHPFSTVCERLRTEIMRRRACCRFAIPKAALRVETVHLSRRCGDPSSAPNDRR